MNKDRGYWIAVTIGASVGLAIGILQFWPAAIIFIAIGTAITVFVLKSISLFVLILVFIVQLLVMSLVLFCLSKMDEALVNYEFTSSLKTGFFFD